MLSKCIELTLQSNEDEFRQDAKTMFDPTHSITKKAYKVYVNEVFSKSLS